jgi:hypothetical protein
VGIPLVIIGLILILVPVYLSSGSFRQLVQAKADQATGGTLNIGGLSIGWLRGIRASQVKFRDATGWATVDVGGVDAHPSLASLLGGTFSMGQTVIDKPTIQIDLRKRPASAPTAAAPSKPAPSGPPQPVLLPVVGDVAIHDGVLRVTDMQGRTVNIAQVNTTMNMRQAGETSQLTARMTVSNSGQPGSISATATVTPSKSEGWSLKGTTGQLTVEVNDLDLGSLNGLLELAGVKIETDGHLSANIQSKIDNGNVQDLTAAITGKSILIGGPALKGDQLRTSKLLVNSKIGQTAGAMQISQLQAQTDWATVNAAGTVPTGAKTLAELVKSNPPLNLKGDFQADLAAVLSQMPHTLSLKPGMKFTAGKATGNFTAATQNGMADIAAHAEIAGLTGTVDGKALTLSAPLIADAKLSGNDKTMQIQTASVTSAFAKVNASGDLSNVNYDGQFDLAKLQAEVGQFANLGKMRLAGQFAAKGQAVMTDKTVGTTGNATIQQLVVNVGDGNSITEPSAQIRYAVNIDKPTNVLNVTDTGIKASFGSIDVPKAVVPLQANSTAPMQANVAIQAVDLKKLAGYGAALGFVPKNLDLSGTANSQLVFTGQKNTYRIQTTSTTIDNLSVTAAGQKPLQQKQVTVTLDGQVNPTDKAYAVDFQLNSPQLKGKGQFSNMAKGTDTTLRATVQGQVDWAAVRQVASAFLPEGLQLSGNRDISVDLTSTYPMAKPESMQANLTGKASAGIDGAQYMGLNIGPTNVNVGIQKGLVTISPINTTINKGQFNFGGAQTNLAEKPMFLRTTQPLSLKNVQIDDIVAATLLKHVNPIFGNATAVSGIVSFDCPQMTIPLQGGAQDKAALNGTFAADSIMLQSAGLLMDILKVLNQNTGQKMVIHPTNIVLKDSVVRYDNMQVDVGNTPTNFGGAIGPQGKLDMTVTLPWTFQGRTTVVGKEAQAGARVPVPLTGTVDHPQLDVSKFLQQGLFQGLQNLLPR